MTLDAEHPGGAIPEPPEASEPDDDGSTGSSTDGESTAVAGTASSPQPLRRRGGEPPACFGAAMLAVGEILEPEKTRVEIVQTDDEPLDDLPFGIDFGDLPPLD
jgi:hypothetical protein